MNPILKTAALLAVLATPAAALAPVAFAAGGGVPLSAELPDHMLSTYALHGMAVVNDYNQPWGVVADILIPPKGEPMAVVDVSKQVGTHKMVLVPLSHLTMAPGHAMMRGATRAMAEQLPAFGYMAGGGAG